MPEVLRLAQYRQEKSTGGGLVEGGRRKELDGDTEVRYRGPEYERMTSLEGDTGVVGAAAAIFVVCSSAMIF